MKNIHPNVIVRIHAGGHANQETKGVQVPLNFLELDTPFTKQVTHRYVQDDDNHQQDPDPRDEPGQCTEGPSYPFGQPCFWQPLPVRQNLAEF